jgi:hypothetical protein
LIATDINNVNSHTSSSGCGSSVAGMFVMSWLGKEEWLCYVTPTNVIPLHFPFTPDRLSCGGAIRVDNHIYIMQQCNQMMVYNVAVDHQQSWNNGPIEGANLLVANERPIPIALSSPSRIMVIGSGDSCQIYDITSQGWYLAAKLTTNRDLACGIEYRGFVYVCGGGGGRLQRHVNDGNQ